MLKKSIVTFLTGATFISVFTFLPHLSKNVAQGIEDTLIAQSTSQIAVQYINSFNGGIVALNTSPDGKTLIVASNDRKITAVNLNNLEIKYSKSLNINSYSNIVFSSDGKLFAVAEQNQIFLHQTETGNMIKTLQGHTDNISGLAISPDNRILVSVSGQELTIKIWDLEQGTLIRDLGEDVGAVTTVAFNPDGKFFVTGAVGIDRTIKFWDSNTLELLKTLPQQPGFIYSLGFTSDGRQLVAAVRNFVKAWDLSTNKERWSVRAASLDLNQVVVSPDNRLLATASREGNIVIMDINKGQKLATLTGHQGWVQSVSFSPDGKTLYSGAEDKIVKIWDISGF